MRLLQPGANRVLVDDIHPKQDIEDEGPLGVLHEDGALHAKLDVGSGQLAPVMEQDAVAEVEGVRLAIARDILRRGKGRFNVQPIYSRPGQLVIDQQHRPDRPVVRHRVWLEGHDIAGVTQA